MSSLISKNPTYRKLHDACELAALNWVHDSSADNFKRYSKAHYDLQTFIADWRENQGAADYCECCLERSDDHCTCCNDTKCKCHRHDNSGEPIQ